jgi:hypothetical protein
MVAVKQQLAVPGLVVLHLSGGKAQCQQLRHSADINRLKPGPTGPKCPLEACKASMLCWPMQQQ